MKKASKRNKLNNNRLINKIINFIYQHRYIFIFLIIMIIGMYLRFYRIEYVQGFGWDQARDAWKVRDIIKGQLVLNGPRTGIGHFHLGPLWYYLMVPFYLLTNLDPMGAIHLNFVVNIFNFIAIFFVTRKIFNDKSALFVSLIYATNRYLVEMNRTSCNVSPVTGVAAILFYSIYQVVVKQRYNFIFLISFLTGLFFHLHFSFAFLPLIILLSFILVKDKKIVLIKGLLSLPLLFIWFIPIVFYEIQSKSTNTRLFSNFLKDYLIDGFHLRFFLHRLHDGFVQFQVMLRIPRDFIYGKFIVPIIYIVTVFFDKDSKQKILAYLIMLWFLIPSFGYSFYGGTTSEYYMLMNSVLVIYILNYFNQRLLSLKFKPMIYLLAVIWIVFIGFQTKDIWIKKEQNGLVKQKEETQKRINENNKIEFNEGLIESYLWQIWVEDKKK